MWANHRWKNKEKYKGAFILMAVQLVVVVVGFFVLKTFYLELTVEEGIVEEQHGTAKQIEQVDTKNINLKETKIEESEDSLLYDGIFGKLQVAKKQLPGTSFHHKTMILHEINIDNTKLKNFLYARQLQEENKIDKYLFSYITNQTGKYLQLLSDLSLLEKKIGKTIISKPKKSIKVQLENLQNYIVKEKFEKVLSFLKEQDNFYKNILGKNSSNEITFNTNFVGTKEFKYLFNKLNKDKVGFYKQNLKDVSNIFGIDQELIKSAILTEQLRGFFTYKGIMKTLIGGQTYMMVMTQSSRGIGGIKEKTAKKIENFMQKSYPNIYRKYFQFSTRNIKNERFQRLTNNHNYFHQILYVAGNIKMNIDLRKKAGIDISNNPGVILTLYNIGERKPHKNPEIGGANLNIAGQKFSFGSLGMFLYYYMKIYN